MLSLELGILSIERRRTPDHLDDDGSCLLREPFGDRARFLVDQAAKLHLHQLSRAQRLVKRRHECGRNAVRSDVHEGIEMMSFRTKFSPFFSANRHVS